MSEPYGMAAFFAREWREGDWLDRIFLGFMAVVMPVAMLLVVALLASLPFVVTSEDDPNSRTNLLRRQVEALERAYPRDGGTP